MRVVFDIDDTISRHRNRDYANAEPLSGVIEQMRALRETNKDAVIVLHTARGMNSCGGDARKAEEKNRATLEEWLKRHNVPYDEIIFGKPLADVYVDDKAVRPNAFARYGYGTFSGFSGKSVERVGDLVIKECANAQEQFDWYAEDAALRPARHRTPDVYAVTLGKLYMQYVPGGTYWEAMTHWSNRLKERRRLLYKVLGVLQEFKEQTFPGENNIEQYVSGAIAKAAVIGLDMSEEFSRIRGFRILNRVTQCHGDMTFSNVLNTDIPTLIDPSQRHGLHSWLVDAAKIRASLKGLNAVIEGSDKDISYLIPQFDEHFTSEEMAAIEVLEKTHIVRVAHTAHKRGKAKEVELLKALL